MAREYAAVYFKEMERERATAFEKVATRSSGTLFWHSQCDGELKATAKLDADIAKERAF